MLIRYSPGGMRKENSGSKLDPIGAFRMDRLDNLNNFYPSRLLFGKQYMACLL